jgi:L-amino acid N-acyltransferase YncA
MTAIEPLSGIRLHDCTEEEHAGAILDILNDAIVTSTALYDYVPRPASAMVAWFATKRANGFPVIGAFDKDGTLLGFASWGFFRTFPAYKYSVEHSVYVHKDHRGRKLGPLLMRTLVERAKAAGMHAMVGCIDASNEGSIQLHKRLGFVHTGTMPQIAFKFGRWLDAAFYQLTLETPNDPVDG